jgi:thiol-disulfide isomerase/thioredoxin
MSREIRITRRELILYSIAFLVVAFVGVLLGNWFITSHQARAYERQVLTRPPATATIKSGDIFPAMELTDLDGRSVSTSALINGHKTLLILLSPGCEPCALAIAEWQEYKNKIPDDLSIIGVVNIEPDPALLYISDNGFPFSVFCDTANILAVDYGLVGFPTIVGIDDKGKVIFISEGWQEGFSPLKAYKLIEHGR